MKKLALVPIAALALASGVAAQQAAAAPATHAVRITARASGLSYDKKVVYAKAGHIQVVFTNLSSLHHNVRVELGEHELGGTKTIGHGMTAAFVTLKRGTYHFYCSVPGHEDAGMSGKLVVT